MAEFVKVKCGCCGHVTQQKEKEIEICFGSCDLDTRPSAPARYNVEFEIQSCPDCGYAQTDLATKIRGVKDIVATEEYANIGNNDYPESVNNYLKAAYLCKDPEDKFFHYLSASWVFDDKLLDDNAMQMRNLALEVSKELKNTTTDIKLIIIDLYRRNKMFAEANQKLDELGEGLPSPFGPMAKYQRRLIKKKDIQIYTMKEALEHEGKKAPKAE